MASIQGGGSIGTAHEGTVFHCNIDGRDHKIQGGKMVDASPEDIQDAHSNGNYLQEISNWRDYDNRSVGATSRSSKIVTPNNIDRAPISGDISSWVEQAAANLREQGIIMSDQDKADMATIAMHESSGNPSAINKTDQNWLDGHPSIGLTQTIQSTFDTFKLPGHDDIMNPVDNIIAGYRYAVATYGSPANTPGITAVNSGQAYSWY